MAGRNELTSDVTETEDFCILQIQSKRGSGTRDEDRVKATLKRDTREDVEAEREALIEQVRATLTDVRAIQPDVGDDE